MNMRKRFTGFLTAAVSALLASCASSQEAAPSLPVYPPMIVASDNAPSPDELYAQRFQTSVAQVQVVDRSQFVLCEDRCPGATPKTPVASVNAAVIRKLRKRVDEQDRPKITPAVIRTDVADEVSPR